MGGSPENRGEAGGEGTAGVSWGTSSGPGWWVLTVMGVMSVKKVKVMDGLGFSTRGGMPSGQNETIERSWGRRGGSAGEERQAHRRRRRPPRPCRVHESEA